MNYEEIAFNIIRYSAEAKSVVMEYLDKIEANIETDSEISKAKELLIEAHKSHAMLVQAEANGTKHEFSLLIMHAEDQLMNVEMLLDMTERFEKLYARLNKCTC